MILKRYSLKLFLIIVFSQNVFADNALPEFTAKYAIQKFGIKLAEAEYQLRYTDTGYKFTQKTKLYGVASMFRDDSVNAVSFVDNINGQLLLKKHSFKQTGKEKNRDEDFAIQWHTDNEKLSGKISGMVRSQPIQHNINTPVWEVLSFQLPLMIDAKTSKKDYPYNALLKGEIATYNFELTNNKTIVFADKDYQTLHLVRKDQQKDRQLHLWLAPAMHNLPIVIENYRDGKEHSRMQLESVQFNNDKTITTIENDDEF